MRKILQTLILSLTFATATAQATDPWTEYMMPAAEHKMLETYAGEFDVEITMWMTPGQAPQVLKVKSTNRMTMGNRFLEMTQSGNMMGMDFQSVTQLGFNTSSKEFALTSVTNMGTGILTLHGGWDGKSKVANVTGQITNPVTKKPIKVRQQISFVNANTLLIENFDTMDGVAESKSIQYKLTRKP